MRLLFLVKLNQVLNEFEELYNNHQLQTESNWTPDQMWLNGMLTLSNPLAENLIDNDIHNANVNRMDPKGPSPFENRDSNVVIPELILNHDTEIIRY